MTFERPIEGYRGRLPKVTDNDNVNAACQNRRSPRKSFKGF